VLIKGGSCRSTDHSCCRDPPRLTPLAEITRVRELPTPPGALKLASDLLSMPEAENRFQSDGLAALLAANLPPDMKKLWLWLDPPQIILLRTLPETHPQRSGLGSCAEPITANRQ
jgi:hypothetical protein